MLKSVKLSIVLSALIILVFSLTQVAFAAAALKVGQDPAAGTPETTKSPRSSTKSSKKRKKKKGSTDTFIVVGALPPSSNQPASQPVSGAESVTGEMATPVPATPAQPTTTRGRGGVSVARMPGIHILPTAASAPLVPATAGQLVISEFRVRRSLVDNDEFIEIFNNSGADHTVDASGTGTGYGIAASDGIVRCTIPDGTVIPNKGHYLCVNSVGYSLGSYPAGNGTTATGDATYTTDIPDNAGIAIFSTNVPAEFALATRLDLVGSTSEANTLYKEGTGYPALTPLLVNNSFYRDSCGKQGSITTFGLCPSGGNLVDTDNNATDFVFVDTLGNSAGAGQRLGAPGPENLSSPIQRNAVLPVTLLDTCVGGPSPPNRVRDFNSDTINNSTFGTLDIRRTITNSTGANVTRLRFRVVDITTFPAPSGIADLRLRTSSAVVVTVDRPPCGSGTSSVTVQGTTLEQTPSPNQPGGGGFNSSMSAGTVTLATPLANGATIDVRFLLGIQRTDSLSSMSTSKHYRKGKAKRTPCLINKGDFLVSVKATGRDYASSANV